jgi:hypothetical protein
MVALAATLGGPGEVGVVSVAAPAALTGAKA